MSNIYCPKCGRENAEGSAYCVSCGAPLTSPPAGAQYAERRPRRNDECFGRGEEQECFGLPWGGIIAALIFGGLLIFLGIGIWQGWNMENFLGPAVMVLIGGLLVAGALYGYSKRRK